MNKNRTIVEKEREAERKRQEEFKIKKFLAYIKKKNKDTDDEYYDLSRILEYEPHSKYYLIFGMRSNGKSFSVLDYMLFRYINFGEKGAIIRRNDSDFKTGRGKSMFNGVVDAGRLDGTDYTGITFRAGAFYLYTRDEETGKDALEPEPFCYSFALTTSKHDKSTSYPDVTTILFDEFMDRDGYLANEFEAFMNTVSTIRRRRNNVKIFLCGNTVDPDCLYFDEFGLQHVEEMKIGTMTAYRFGDTGNVTHVLEYCENINKNSKIDEYYCFDNPSLKMITDGDWEISAYPHLPMEYREGDIVQIYFIKWKDHILQAEIIKTKYAYFTYIHKKTTPIQDENKDLIFSETPDPRMNWRRRINNVYDKLGEEVWRFFVEDKVYFQDNMCGEYVRRYLKFCQQYSIIR